MESSHIFEGIEECHSSESGWTMYIGSPINGNDSNDDDDDDNDDDVGDGNSDGGDSDDGNGKNYNDDEESDDSMASDASSGPSHQGHFRGDDKHEAKYCLKKKDRMERKKEEKEEKTRRDKTVSAHTGSKVRKSFWLSKTK